MQLDDEGVVIDPTYPHRFRSPQEDFNPETDLCVLCEEVYEHKNHITSSMLDDWTPVQERNN